MVSFDQFDPHELQGGGVHDVEAAASVHKNLGEAGVADDGVDNKRVSSRVRDVVEVVLAAKGNGLLRPIELGWRGLGDGEDFPALTLALPRGHVRRWSSKDEEGVLHRGGTRYLHLCRQHPSSCPRRDARRGCSTF